MSDYKIGDVAALFPKPKKASTPSQKKLQSLFEEFNSKKSPKKHEKRRKSHGESDTEEVNVGQDLRSSEKKKKSKIPDVRHSESGSEGSNKKKFERMFGENVEVFEHAKKKKKSNSFSADSDFSRKEKKSAKLNSNSLNYNIIQGNVTEAANKASPRFIRKSKSQMLKSENGKFIKEDKHNTFTEDSVISDKQLNVSDGNDDLFKDGNKEAASSSKKSKKKKKKNFNALTENSVSNMQGKGEQNLKEVSDSEEELRRSLFSEFSSLFAAEKKHKNKRKSNEKKEGDEAMVVNDLRSPGKKKKRKFSDIGNSESSTESGNKKSFKHTNEENAKSLGNVKNKVKSFSTVDFPRTKKKATQRSSNNLNSSKFSVTENSPGKNHLFDNNSESNNSLKASKQISSFIKKVKNEKDSVKIKSSEKIVDYDSETSDSEVNSEVANEQLNSFDDSDMLFKSEIKEEKSNSKKSKKKKNINVFTENSEATIKSEIANKQLNAFDDSDISLKSEIKEESKSNSKESKKKKKNINVFTENSDSNIQGQGEPGFIKLSTSDSRSDEEKLKCTLFVGNLPLNTTRKALTKLFSVFGPIDYVRFREIATKKNKMYKDGEYKGLNSNYAAESLPGFIIFKERQSAVDALSLSGSVFNNNHITVDFAMPPGSKKIYDEKRSVFIGNLPFDVKDESVWNAFAECGKVEGVRIVRDRMTGIGKGFGYVLFNSVQAKENALNLNDVEIGERIIRIKAVSSNKNSQNKPNVASFKKDSFKSRAIKYKRNNKDTPIRKSVNKIMKKQKNLHKKKKIASMLQKSMK